MELRTKAEFVGGIIIIAAITWGSYYYHDKKVQESVLQVSYLKGQMQAKLDEEIKLKLALDKIKSENASLRTRYNSTKVLPAPQNVPALPEITQHLVDSGMEKGLVITEDLKVSQLTVRDAELVWIWEAQAGRVGSFEAKLVAAEALIDGLTKESAEKDKINESADAALEAAVEAQKALEEMLKSQLKKETAGKWKTLFKVVGAGIIGYEAGKRLNH